MSLLTKAVKSISDSVFSARNSRRALENYCHRLDITDRLLALKDEFDRKGVAFAE
jgi:hypothetical protein